jgi:pimeloyl-ACP methyl ester carboxylesterase
VSGPHALGTRPTRSGTDAYGAACHDASTEELAQPECGPWGFSLGDVTRPVHVWWGEADPFVRRAHAEYLATAIPNARLATNPGEGHLFPLNHWAEMLATLLRE